MVLMGLIRRAASRVVPLAVQASAGSKRCLHNQHSSALFPAAASNCSRTLPQRAFPLFNYRYYTVPSAVPNNNTALLKVIESEIQCAAESQEADEVEEVPEGFPFEIEDHPGQVTITLTRVYQSETISVEVHMPDLVTGEQDENDQGDEEGGGNRSSLPLVVRISKKGGGPSLEFGCIAYPDEVQIESLAIKDPNNTEDQIAYEGPDFMDLDENLQKAFHKYLQIRGVKPSTTNFLHGYMVDKDAREYVTWLKNLQRFVEG